MLQSTGLCRRAVAAVPHSRGMLRRVFYAGVLVVSSAGCERTPPPAANGDGEAEQALGTQHTNVDGGTSAPPAVVRDASTDSLDVSDARAPGKAEPPAPPADGRPELWDQSLATACRSTRRLCPSAECETLTTVLDSARRMARRWSVRLNRDQCQDAAGTKYTILTQYGLPTIIYLFRADTGKLVSRILRDDVPICPDETSNTEITGALIPECTWADPDAMTLCSDADEPNVHALETCIYRFMPETAAPVPSSPPEADAGTP